MKQISIFIQDDSNPTLKVWADRLGLSETTLSFLGFGVLVPVALTVILIPIIAYLIIRKKGYCMFQNDFWNLNIDIILLQEAQFNFLY